MDVAGWFSHVPALGYVVRRVAAALLMREWKKWALAYPQLFAPRGGFYANEFGRRHCRARDTGSRPARVQLAVPTQNDQGAPDTVPGSPI